MTWITRKCGDLILNQTFMSHPSIPRFHCPPHSESPWGTRFWRAAICTLNLRLSSMAELLTAGLWGFSSDQVIHSTGNLTLWTRSCEKLPADYWPLLICAAGLPLVAQTVKICLTNSGGSSLIPGWKDHLEKGMATHSIILA